MGTVADKLSRMADSKEALRVALGLDKSVPFRDYAGAVTGQGGPAHCIAFSPQPPERTDCLWIRGEEPDRIQLTQQLLNLRGDAPSLSFPVAQIQAVSLGGKLWTCGGWGPYPTESDDWIRNDEIRYFDPAQGHVVTPLRLPQGLCRVAMAAVGEKLYFFGGQGINRRLTDQILVLDTASMELATLETTLPVPSYRYAAAVGEMIYLFGGFNGDSELDEILAFDTRDNSIRTLDTRLPEIAWALGVAQCGGRIYLFGGQRGTSPTTGMDRILRFDPADESLTEMAAKLPKVHMNPVPVTVGEDIWLLGGYRYTVSGVALYEFYDSVDIYHTREDWLGPSGVTLPEPRAYMAAGLVDGKLYAFGGMVTKDIYSADGWFVETKPALDPGTLRICLGSGPSCTLLEGKVALRTGVESLIQITPEGNLTKPYACAWYNNTWNLIGN